MTMPMEAIEPASPSGDSFAQISDTIALIIGDEDTLGPDICPDIVPAGWSWTGEIADFEFKNGDWREVYILERQ